MNEKKFRKLSSRLFLSVLLGCLVVSAFVLSVSAQLPYFTLNFDRINYDLGSTGTVAIDIESPNQAFEISRIGFTLYLPTIDGTLAQTEFFGVNYGDSPLPIPTGQHIPVSIDIVIPQRNDIISGVFLYFFEVDIREQGTTTYEHETYGLVEAMSYGYYCLLYSPQTDLSPSPTISPSPTPTSTPTTTPTPTATLQPTPTPPTPTPTSTPRAGIFLPIEALIGIGVAITVVVIIVIILVELRKRRD